MFITYISSLLSIVAFIVVAYFHNFMHVHI